MRKRITRSVEKAPKKIHIAWPVLCQVELADAASKLGLILGRIKHRGDQDYLVQKVRSAIDEIDKAMHMFNETYGE